MPLARSWQPADSRRRSRWALVLLIASLLVPAAPARAADTATTPGGAPVTVTIASAGGTASLAFAGTAGDRVSLELTQVTVGTSTCCSTKVSILRPDGKVLASATVGTSGGFLGPSRTTASPPARTRSPFARPTAPETPTRRLPRTSGA
ncbi:MAG: hypothetical protein M3327_02520 [Actinomycetota bacterium]|nr:hypothetical protein [Actinomycetota bacterium]